MKNVDDFTKPVVMILFKELTVLGCIALLVFMSVKTGIPQQISVWIFETPSELVEMFDMAHVLIFLIVVLFVTMISMILWRFRAYCQDWEAFELSAIDADQQGKTRRDIKELTIGNPPRPMPEEIKAFVALRRNFMKPPIKQVGARDLDIGFKFSAYLKACTTEVFKDLVEIEPETWYIVLGLCFFARLFMMIPHEEIKIAVYMFVGLIILGVMVALRNKLLEVFVQLTHIDPDADETDLPHYQLRYRQRQRDSRAAKEKDTWFYKWCNEGKEPNAHEALFFGWRFGPSLAMHTIRTCSFLASVYFAMLVFRFLGDFERGMNASVLLILSIVPPIIMMAHYVPVTLKLLILTTSTEMLRRREVVYEVEHGVRMRRRFFVARLSYALIGYAKRILKRESEVPVSMPEAHQGEVREVFEIYEVDIPETSKGGKYVPKGRVQDMFRQLGMQIDEEEVEDLCLELGEGQDGIVYARTLEFLAGVAENHVLTDQMVDAIFVDVDRDNQNASKKFDNEITEDEFCAKLSQVNSYFGTPGSAGGAEALIEWLDWAVEFHKIKVTTKNEEIEGADGTEINETRVFTPQTFRQLLKLGTALG
jgi:hypothetical protein